MANNTATTTPVPRRAGVDAAAWEHNGKLARDLAEARGRVERALNPKRRTKAEREVERLSEQLYLDNVALARRIASKYLRRSDCADDLYQEADMALWQAITRWDPEMSPLGSWAHRYIEKACRNYVARDEHRLSPWTWQKRPDVLAAEALLRDRGEVVTVERVAELAEVTVDTARVILERQSVGKDLSLDAVVGDGDATLADVIAEQIPDDSTIDLDRDDQRPTVDAATRELAAPALHVWGRVGGYDSAVAEPTEALEATLRVSAETVRRLSKRASSIVDEAIAALGAE